MQLLTESLRLALSSSATPLLREIQLIICDVTPFSPTESVDLCLLIVPCFFYSRTLKTEAVFSSKMSVSFYQTTRRHVQQANTFHSEER
jgi:hypothetical protein